ncbi:sugar ABC transporter permease [Streptomyces phaeochromogenes]|uniref:carbohydrate ABC transporter permease n=1 Tax=Streptomyces phaeochromogenes TaxID=1923 RepID=UPI002DDC4868|nr:sugar ABC transporter permease [Streptomyces phaeochromogenes]WRZ34643.1 sugar ABC transporter permease [Streptomyces phaeochromogenes]
MTVSHQVGKTSGPGPDVRTDSTDAMGGSAARPSSTRAPRIRAGGRGGMKPPWWFLVPGLLFYAYIVVVPSIRGSAYAFTDWTGLGEHFNWVGLDNFRDILDDDAARSAITNTLVLAFVVTAGQILLGLLLALGVHSRVKSRYALRVMFFAPVVVTPLVSGFVWQYLLAPTGSLNAFLGTMGLESWQQDWLGSPHWALWSVCAVIIWQHTGISMSIFLAGLQSVPQDVIEAAHLDGAGPFRRFWSVVRPFLLPAFTINLSLAIIGALKQFDIVMVMTGGGPGNASDTISTLIYKDAFTLGQWSYGVALALVLTVFVMVISGFQYALMNRAGRSS